MSLRKDLAFDKTFVLAALTLGLTTTRGNVTVTTKLFRVVDDPRSVREQRMTTYRADQLSPTAAMMVGRG